MRIAGSQQKSTSELSSSPSVRPPKYRNSWHRCAILWSLGCHNYLHEALNLCCHAAVVRKEVDESKQLTWQHSFPGDPHVAIIGGGIAGLSCAKELARHGIRSVVFDTGEHGAGGRLATRSTRDKSIRKLMMQDDAYMGSDLVFDHAGKPHGIKGRLHQSMAKSMLIKQVLC